MTMNRWFHALAPLLVALSVVVLLAPGHGATAKTSHTPDCPPLPKPSQFVAKIDNPYLPLKPGTTLTYTGTEEGVTQGDVVKVTNDTKLILGVNVRVVRDTVTDRKGNVLEDTRDWYAQDQTGNVWYFGEDTKEYKNGKLVTTAGSWQAGDNGAKAGIIMEAHPKVGDTYGQECAPGVAEDRSRIFQVGASVTVPYGTFTDTLVTEEFSLLEPGVLDHKWYAPGIGVVREERVQGGSEVLELVNVQ
jgi:hypothetical protein